MARRGDAFVVSDWPPRRRRVAVLARRGQDFLFSFFCPFFLFLCLTVSTMHVHSRQPAAHARATRASRPRRREPRPSARSVTRSHSLPARPGATRRQPAARRGWAEPPASAAPHAHRRSPLWASVHGGLRRGIGATPGGEPIDASRSSRGTRPPPGSPRRCLGTWRIRLACPAHNRGRRRCGRGS